MCLNPHVHIGAFNHLVVQYVQKHRCFHNHLYSPTVPHHYQPYPSLIYPSVSIISIQLSHFDPVVSQGWAGAHLQHTLGQGREHTPDSLSQASYYCPTSWNMPPPTNSKLSFLSQVKHVTKTAIFRLQSITHFCLSPCFAAAEAPLCPHYLQTAIAFFSAKHTKPSKYSSVSKTQLPASSVPQVAMLTSTQSLATSTGANSKHGSILKFFSLGASRPLQLHLPPQV